MQKLCPFLFGHVRREAPEVNKHIVNTAKFVQNILEKPEV